MSGTSRKVTFYHSVACPRCHVSGIMLALALRRHPDIEVTRVELLTNLRRARKDGVKSIPALVAGGRKLTGLLLTTKNIERFLESLERTSPEPQ